MDSRELLGLLTVKVQSFSNAPSSFSRLTPEDIAYILGTIKHPPAVLFARIKYADQTQYAEELAFSMRRDISNKINDIGKWRIPRPNWVLDMCKLAVCEAAGSTICPTCLGVAERLVDHRKVVCGGCQGTGKRPLRDKDRADIMRTSKSAWCHSWSDRYREIQNSTVDIFEDIVTHAIRKRLG